MRMQIGELSVRDLTLFGLSQPSAKCPGVALSKHVLIKHTRGTLE